MAQAHMTTPAKGASVGISIDLDKCHQDGFCSRVCPASIIAMEGPEGTPSPAAGFEEICLHCGHCLAVCPHGALSLDGVSPDEVPPVSKELAISPAQAAQFMLSRRSIRRYQDKVVDRALLEQALDIARQAPSGHNAQPVEWVVYSGREQVKRISDLVTDWLEWLCGHNPEIALPLHLDLVVAQYRAGHDRVFRGAPHLIITHAHQDNGFAQSSAFIALTFLDLAAHSLGLGACWAGYFNRAAQHYKPLQEALALPEGHISFGGMMLGHPQYRYLRIPRRNPLRVAWR
ncbi:MAG: 4Fe-4S dicluster domain-containing protein [Desulfarculus sp.]|jgi:nitroreductase/ferredoxin|nr:MAG: 4Fe-4S dicluster domain-containing protein [Desulfarculus sp.]